MDRQFDVNLNGKFAIVTGAASGIGLATVTDLLRAGAEVLAVDRDAEKLKAIDGPVHRLVVDLAEPGAPQAIVREASKFSKVIDAFVSCAGIFEVAAVEDVTAASFDRIVAINLRAPLLIVGAARPHFSNNASVVLVASGASILPASYQSVYVASKAGVAKLAASLAAELSQDGIRVNAVSPGFTDTPMLVGSVDDSMKKLMIDITPDKAIGTPSDVSGAILFLLSDASRHIHGINLPVDGGSSQVSINPRALKMGL